MLEDVVKAKLLDFHLEPLEPFATHLQQTLQSKAQAIIAYGSCLSQVTKTESSTPDFYVITSNYRGFYSSKRHALINWFLPPNVYHFTLEGRTAKYNVLSLKDFVHETSYRARDFYNMGRLSKRLAILWVNGQAMLELVARAQASAMRQVARRAYFFMPKSFGVEAFARACLKLSYEADLRVEAPDKVNRLFDAEREFYLRAYGLVLDEMTGSPFYLRRKSDADSYEKMDRGFRDVIDSWDAKFFIRFSKLRAQLRWPKGMFTVDNWIDYITAKIERTQGIRLELTEKEKRLWYIYGWKYFFRLRRKHLIR